MKKSLKEYIIKSNILTKADCKNIINELNKKLWKKHQYNNPLTNSSMSYEDDLEILFENSEATSFLMPKIVTTVKEYVNHFKFPWLNINNCSIVRFNKYEIGTRMRIHADHIHTLFDGQQKGIPILTVVGTLNDNYEGGKFVMFDDMTIDLKAGDILVFPSLFLYPHEVKKITKGTRYSYVVWCW